MQMVCADQMEIFQIKGATFGGTPHFPLYPLVKEIAVPFAQNFHFHFVVILHF